MSGDYRSLIVEDSFPEQNFGSPTQMTSMGQHCSCINITSCVFAPKCTVCKASDAKVVNYVAINPWLLLCAILSLVTIICNIFRFQGVTVSLVTEVKDGVT